MSLRQISPDVLFREAGRLGLDLRENLAAYDQSARAALTNPAWLELHTLHLVGCGDSYHASRVAQLAFQTLAGIRTLPEPANAFVNMAWLEADRVAPRSALIALSASGGTARVADALRHATKHRMPTLAVTGRADSLVAGSADASCIVEIRDPEASPGVRTFQASLLGLLVLAIRLGELRGVLAPRAANEWLDRIAAMPSVIETLSVALRPVCEALSPTIARSPYVFFAGDGPNYGSALNAAAKLVESSGVMAVTSDTEEWWHVERFARYGSAPMIVFGCPATPQDGALRLIDRALEAGREVIVVGPSSLSNRWRHLGSPPGMLGYPENVPPMLGCLANTVMAALLAGCVARSLNRYPFQGAASGASMPSPA